MEKNEKAASPVSEKPPKKEKDYKKLAASYKGQATRFRNLLKTTLSSVNRAKLGSAINDVVPGVILIRRGDVFRIVAQYNRLLREELGVK